MARRNTMIGAYLDLLNILLSGLDVGHNPHFPEISSKAEAQNARE